MGKKLSKDVVLGWSNISLIPLGVLEYKFHCRVCPILICSSHHGPWERGHNSQIPLGTITKLPLMTQEQSSKESCGDEPLAAAPTAAGRWTHQMDKRDLGISEQCADSTCYRREALFLFYFGRAMWHVGSSFPRQDHTRAPRSGSVGSYNLWSAREVPGSTIFEGYVSESNTSQLPCMIDIIITILQINLRLLAFKQLIHCHSLVNVRV